MRPNLERAKGFWRSLQCYGIRIIPAPVTSLFRSHVRSYLSEAASYTSISNPAPKIYSFFPSPDMPKLKRVRQGTSVVLAMRSVARSNDQNSQRLFPCVPFAMIVYADFLSGVTCRPAIPAGVGPIGLKLTAREVRSNRAMPNTRL